MAANGGAVKGQPLRYACDRCHFHKLRCSRTDQRASGNPDTDEPCSRCRKAQVTCVQGVRGKVGRPAKSLKRKASQYEETYRTPSNDGSEASHEYQQRREGQDELSTSPIPDAITHTITATMPPRASDADSEEDSRPTSRPCLRSPLQYQTPVMSMFPLNTSEGESWETLMMPDDSFESGFVTSFDLPPFPTPVSETCFQEGPTTSPNGTDGIGRDMMGSISGATPSPLSQFFNTEAINDYAEGRVGSGDHPGSSPSSSGHVPTPTPSTSFGGGARTSYGKLSDLNLRINTVLGSSGEDIESGGRILKDVSSLASELIDAARQIMPLLVTDISVPEGTEVPPPQAASAGGQETSLQSEASPTNDATMPRRAHGSPRPRRRCGPDSGLVFLFLACYSGILNIFELIVSDLWARRSEFAERGGSVGSLLETSLAVHTINYLFRLLRGSSLLWDSSGLETDPALDDDSAGWCGGGPAGGRGRAPGFGLLRATCAGMRDREQQLLRRTQCLQQLLIR
ncbi:hypothetical protein PG994_009820 [Apiospora phragmitis]|uniref:Zn(2)-C6 fungal-type domain-containing protein n=1 Tax=Apiospora phragmitis TaxID=2905665 RepID=A0ABR1U9X6_9PEZI